MSIRARALAPAFAAAAAVTGGLTGGLAGAAIRARALRHRLATARQELDDALHTDPVTGLATRASLMDLLEEGGRFAVVVLALGGVADVEDSLGYAWADALRAELADRLLRVAPDGATIARLDGDHLAVAIEGGTSASAHAFATRALRELAHPVRLAGIDVSCTASAGISSAGLTSAGLTSAGISSAGIASAGLAVDATDTGIELLQRAVAACRTTTVVGSPRITELDPAATQLAARRLALAQELRRAVTNEEIEVHYQPVVSLADGRVVGAEALVRWNHPTAGVLLPGEWLEVAISSGAMAEIGVSTLGVSCRRFATLNRGRSTPLTVSVNLSAAELRTEGMATVVSAQLEASGFDPTLLVIEVPEDAFVDTTTASTLEEIAALGVRLAIDDFGTASSSLLELRRFNVDLLKLDGAFVAGACDHPVDAAVVTATCGLARSLGAGVVAEGVTTEATAELLRAEGCELAQGWLYGPAVPFARLVEFVRRSEAAGVNPVTPTL